MAESAPTTRCREEPRTAKTATGSSSVYRPVTTGIPAIFAYPRATGMLTAARVMPASHVRRDARPVARAAGRPAPAARAAVPQGAPTRIRHRHLRRTPGGHPYPTLLDCLPCRRGRLGQLVRLPHILRSLVVHYQAGGVDASTAMPLSSGATSFWTRQADRGGDGKIESRDASSRPYQVISGARRFLHVTGHWLSPLKVTCGKFFAAGLVLERLTEPRPVSGAAAIDPGVPACAPAPS